MLNRLSSLAAPAALLRRVGAAMGIAVLLLLSVSAASPVVHHWLHADTGADSSDNCAVVLFASGVTLAAAAIAFALPALRWVEMRVEAAAVLFVVSPRYLRQPERGPPAS
jgi:hypothetical protein